MAEAWRLLNAEDFELLPTALVRGRSARIQRLLASGQWLARRKCDGRFLAVLDGHSHLHALQPITPVLRARMQWRLQQGTRPQAPLPAHGLQRLLHALGIAPDYGERHRLPQVSEPSVLAYAGRDRYARPLWLLPAAARAWMRMQQAAVSDAVAIDVISGYRSHTHQASIVARKLARGLDIAAILAINAAPGYSEHHSGCALDLGHPGQAPAETSFENTPAFAWLCKHAARFGFHLSYPRDNPHGIVYEPWHWAWRD